MWKINFFRLYFLLQLYLLIFGRAGSSLLLGVFSSCEQGLLSPCGVRASHWDGASRGGAQAYRTQAPLAGARGLRSRGSRAPEHRLGCCGKGLSCSAACGIFPDQGSNPCLLHCQVDSLSLSHQGVVLSEKKIGCKIVLSIPTNTHTHTHTHTHLDMCVWIHI